MSQLPHYTQRCSSCLTPGTPNRADGCCHRHWLYLRQQGVGKRVNDEFYHEQSVRAVPIRSSPPACFINLFTQRERRFIKGVSRELNSTQEEGDPMSIDYGRWADRSFIACLKRWKSRADKRYVRYDRVEGTSRTGTMGGSIGHALPPKTTPTNALADRVTCRSDKPLRNTCMNKRILADARESVGVDICWR